MPVLPGFGLTGHGHALGAGGDLPFHDGKVTLGLGARRLHAGQHCPLLDKASHGSDSCVMRSRSPAALGAA